MITDDLDAARAELQLCRQLFAGLAPGASITREEAIRMVDRCEMAIELTAESLERELAQRRERSAEADAAPLERRHERR